jgi:hypothetical protein
VVVGLGMVLPSLVDGEMFTENFKQLLVVIWYFFLFQKRSCMRELSAGVQKSSFPIGEIHFWPNPFNPDYESVRSHPQIAFIKPWESTMYDIGNGQIWVLDLCGDSTGCNLLSLCLFWSTRSTPEMKKKQNNNIL